MGRTQGPYVVRSSWKWPAHMLENHHRTNSEALVDILAMSKCQFLLHGNSAVSEAAIYLNFDLHHQSVNWEDPDRMSVPQFEQLVGQVIGNSGHNPAVNIGESQNQSQEKNIRTMDHYLSATKAKIIHGNKHRNCKRNAIV